MARMLAILLISAAPALADTAGPGEFAPLDCLMMDGIAPFGMMQPKGKQYAPSPIWRQERFDLIAGLTTVTGGGRVTPIVEPPDASPIPIPAAIALLAPAMMLAGWIATRRKK